MDFLNWAAKRFKDGKLPFSFKEAMNDKWGGGVAFPMIEVCTNNAVLSACSLALSPKPKARSK